MSIAVVSDRGSRETVSSVRSRRRRAALMAAAADVFAKRGYDAATMTEIAAHSGSSIGLLYKYFATKEDIAAAVSTEMCESLLGDIAKLAVSVSETNDAGYLGDRLIDIFIDAAEEKPAFQALSERPPPGSYAMRSRILNAVGRLLECLDFEASPVQRRSAAQVVLGLAKSASGVPEALSRKDKVALVGEWRLLMRTYLMALTGAPLAHADGSSAQRGGPKTYSARRAQASVGVDGAKTQRRENPKIRERS